MLIKMPLASAKFLFENAHAIWTASSMEKFNSKLLASEANISVRSARLLIKNLAKCEFVKKAGREYTFSGNIVDDCLVMNFRDEMLDALSKRRATRAVLLCLARGERSTKRIAEKLNVSRRTVIRVLEDLRVAGIVRGREVASELLYKSQDPLEEIPRSAHRRAVAHFVRCFETYSSLSAPLVLFGEAARGNWQATLKLAALSKFNMPDEVVSAIEALFRSAKETTKEYNVPTSLFLVAEDAWYAQKFKLVKTPHLLLLELLDGIFIHGKPPKDEDYFELIRRYYQPSREKIEKMLQKGHIRPYGSGYSFTEKGIKAWRKKPVEVVEFEYPIDREKIPIISLSLTNTVTPFF